MGVKRKEPIYTGMAVVGLAQTLSEWTHKPDFDLHAEMLYRYNANLLSTNGNICKFFNSTLKQLKAPYEKIRLLEKENGYLEDYTICIYNFGKPFYLLFTGTYLEGMYGSTMEDAIEELGTLVKKELGQFVVLTMDPDGVSRSAGLAKTSSRLDAYVSPIDFNDFCCSTNKFQARGLNRASLLYGPPGVGKTTFSSLVAKELNGTLLVIESNSLNKIMDSGLHLEQLVRIVNPRVILFDDLDRVSNPESLFGEIERLNRNESKQKVLILGSINSLNRLPEPLRRPGRFDEIIKFNLPDDIMRDKILRSHLNNEGVRIMDQYVSNLTEWTAGFSGAELREIALQVSVRGFDEDFLKCRIDHMKQMKREGAISEEEGDENILDMFMNERELIIDDDDE